jgi:hypothetical protein
VHAESDEATRELVHDREHSAGRQLATANDVTQF